MNASIIQGSAIGPAMYVVNAADLHTVMPGNSLMKYADDTYLLIPRDGNRTEPEPNAPNSNPCFLQKRTEPNEQIV